MAVSETFRPDIVYSEDMQCYFIDIAGYLDTNGPFFDLLNSFIIKYLFENARNVKFILPFTHDEIYMTKGICLKGLVDQLQRMSQSHLATFVDSVIPMVTKCKP